MRVEHRSSGNGEWETPPKVFNPLNEEFGFTLDAAASDANHLCEDYFTEEINALVQDWGKHIVWVNPPYGRQSLPIWVAKMLDASRHGATVVALLPARTDTRWFHDIALPYAEIRFLRGRIRFLLQGEGQDPAPFPSMIAVFRPCVHHWLITNPRSEAAPKGFRVKGIPVTHFELTDQRCTKCGLEQTGKTPIIETFGEKDELRA